MSKDQRKSPLKVASMVETIFGCKWSLTVYALIRDGIQRPGEMVRKTEGLSTKVLNDCLKKNMEFGIITKEVFDELPPRVEYSISSFGEKFMKVLYQIEQLEKEL